MIKPILKDSLTRAPEHVQHALRDDKTAADVDGRDEGSQRGQSVQCVVGVVAAAHQQHAAHRRDAGDGVGHRHEWRVESRSHSPHRVVACAVTGKEWLSLQESNKIA